MNKHEVRELFRGGYTRREIARKLGVGYQKVCVAVLFEPPPDGTLGRPCDLTADDVMSMQHSLDSGYTLDQVAQEWELSPGYVSLLVRFAL